MDESLSRRERTRIGGSCTPTPATEAALNLGGLAFDGRLDHADGMSRLIPIALMTLCIAAGEPKPSGSYRLNGGPDSASEMVLRADHRFSYFLSAGALDERAEGVWSANGTVLTLTTQPVPKPPTFTLSAISRRSDVPLSVRVAGPSGQGIAGVDVRVGFDRGDPVTRYTQEYGWSLDPSERRTPRWIEVSLLMYGISPTRFPIVAGDGNALEILLTPNDLGVVDFRGMQIDVGKDQLTLHRNGGSLTYVREPDRPEDGKREQ